MPTSLLLAYFCSKKYLNNYDYLLMKTKLSKIDNLEKELIKKRYELQIMRKDLCNNLEREEKEQLVNDLQRYGDFAVAEMVKVFSI